MTTRGVFDTITNTVDGTSGSFLFANLPAASQIPHYPAGTPAYTSDQGFCIWTGTRWTALSLIAPTADTQILYNNQGNITSSSQLTWSYSTDTLTLGDGTVATSTLAGPLANPSTGTAGTLNILGSPGTGAGAGGTINLQGGIPSGGFSLLGAAGTGTGGGGPVSIIAGNGGPGAGASTGGNMQIQSGSSAASSGNAPGGTIIITAGNASPNGTATGQAGFINLNGGVGAIGGGNGGHVQGNGGNGGAGTNTGNNSGGAVQFTAGNGGVNGTAISNGGAAILTSGNAGANATAGVGGGPMQLKTGTGAGALAGGTFLLQTGQGGATAVGGSITILGGAGGATSGAGAPISITAGSATTSGNGGNVSVTAGNQAGGNTNGIITLVTNAGTITISSGGIKLPGFTVSRLPAAASFSGYQFNVTDASAAPTYWTIAAGGGTNIAKVMSDGTNWRYA